MAKASKPVTWDLVFLVSQGLLVVCRVAYKRPMLLFGDLLTLFCMLAFLLREFWCLFKCSFTSPWSKVFYVWYV